MTDPENKSQGKGFKGLQGLASKQHAPASEPPVLPEQKIPNPESTLPGEGLPLEQGQPSQSQTATPQWHGLVWFGMILVGVVGVSIWLANIQPSSNSYSPQAASDYQTPAVSGTTTFPAPLTEPPPTPVVTMPPVGSGLVFTSDKIRYCVYENWRIQGAQKVVDNYNQSSVNTFNAMVSDFNSRCGHYRYREGALSPIESEAILIQSQLEQEGQIRITGGQAQAMPGNNEFNLDNTSLSSFSSDSTKPPKFSDFPGAAAYEGPRARVNLASEFERSFRTRISDTAYQPVNFSGEYVISTWGCGTSCLMGVAVNARTGTSLPLPGSVCCWDGDGDTIIFRPDSRLLILGGLINESGAYGTHFYELKNSEFVHLYTVPIERQNDASPPVTTASETASVPSNLMPTTGSLTTYQTSFDCTEARSIPEQMICHDPMLSQDDRELSQLYQQAKISVSDRAALTERARKQWNYREKNCRDKRCLSDWYVYQKDVMRKIALSGDVDAN